MSLIFFIPYTNALQSGTVTSGVGGGGNAPPAGFSFIVDGSAQNIIDNDGNYIIGADNG